MRTDKCMTDTEMNEYLDGKLKYCKIRKDLVKSGTAVPIMYKEKQRFIHGDAKREYRWKDEDTFKIWFRDKYWRAYSIDYDFLDDINKKGDE
jgi:hypothetical protein